MGYPLIKFVGTKVQCIKVTLYTYFVIQNSLKGLYKTVM